VKNLTGFHLMQRKSKRVVNLSIIQNKFDKSAFAEKLSYRRNNLFVFKNRGKSYYFSGSAL
jgi:hypothetical protein